MKPIIYKDFIFPLVVLIALLSVGSPAKASEIEIAGRKVKLELIKSNNLSSVNLPNAEFSITAESFVIRAGDSIFKRLEANGIYPDTEAYTLIYDLNPSLEKLDPLVPDTTLIIPKAHGNTVFQKAINEECLVILTVDSEIKNRLRAAIKDIKLLSEKFSVLKNNRFVNPTKREEIIGFVNNLSDWFEHISMTIARRTARPLRKESLLQIVNEAEALRKILKQVVNSNQKLKSAEQAQISAIHEDLSETIKIWDQTMAGELPPADPQYNVVVVIKGSDAEMIKGLRVYYVINGLFRTPPRNPPVPSSNFNGLGSGASAILPIKNYKIWAARDGDPGNPVTPITDLKVRKPASGDTIGFELSLK